MSEKRIHVDPSVMPTDPGDNIESQIGKLGPERAVETGVVSGREVLEWLAENGDYVFHGSDRRLLELEPRQQMQFNPKTGENVPDGEPAVCTARSVDPAIFMGVLKGHGSAGMGSHSGWSFEGNWRFYATADMLESAGHSEAPGYVHVFEANEFRQHQGDEWRAHRVVVPKYVIPVGFNDLPPDIQVADPAEN